MKKRKSQYEGVEQMVIPFEPTIDDICTMCHWSSLCDGCCNVCKEKCNSSQRCGQVTPAKDQIDRWITWVWLRTYNPWEIQKHKS